MSAACKIACFKKGNKVFGIFNTIKRLIIFLFTQTSVSLKHSNVEAVPMLLRFICVICCYFALILICS